MDSVSTSIDIASLKARALAPLEEHGATPNFDLTDATHRTLRHALFQPPEHGTIAHHEHPGNDRNSTGLPSTVPESALTFNASNIPVPAPEASLTSDRLRKMSSQAALEATQELSQSFYEDLINKSRATLATTEQETLRTLKEGDDGHIDITSSFVPNDEEDDEPRAFSPSQSQRRLSQFPESQRVKTPAAGKKRDYNGNTKETPELPRAPLLRSGAPTPAHVLGLTQAFDATQAATSPVVNGEINPLSDRPSPNLQVDNRPATATVSSPLRPISEFRRATTEPAARYISVAQSQAERERRAREQEENESDDDDFDEEPSMLIRQRIQQERKARTDAQFRLLSSPSWTRPRGGSAIQSSPVLAAQRSSPSPPPGRRLSGLSNTSKLDVGLDDEETHASEAETEPEQGEEININVLRSSQTSPMDDENKENFDVQVQIPETTARSHHVVHSLPSQVEASPSLRQGNAHEAGPLPSSAPFAVANSQPSQAATRSQTARRNPKSSSTSGVDFVPQSQANEAQQRDSIALNQPPALTSRTSKIDPVQTKPDEVLYGESHRDVDTTDLEQSSAPAQLATTIPETDSAQVSRSHRHTRSTNSTPSADTVSVSVFETAPTRIPPASNAQSKMLELSSPPILTTPPGLKRKRMSEISAEPSPTQPSTQGFDAAAALNLDTDIQHILDDSPIKPGTRQTKRRKLQAFSIGVEETAGHSDRVSIREFDAENPTSGPTNLDVAELNKGNEASKSHAMLSPPTHRASTRSRPSVFDLGVSPPQKRVPAKRIIAPTRTMKGPNPDRIKVPTSTAPEKRGSAKTVKSSLNRHTQSVNNDAQPLPSVSKVSKPPPGEEAAPNVVFACFNGKSRAYYPARCLGSIEADRPRFRIQWEGYEPDEVDAYGVRRLDLRVGDQVKIDQKGFPKVSHTIQGFKDQIKGSDLDKHLTDIRGYKTVVVAPKQRKSLPADISTEAVTEVPVAAVYLDSNMWNQMRERTFEFKPVRQISIPISGSATPMEQSSTPSTPSSRNRRPATGQQVLETLSSIGLLANMAFAISYEDDGRKTSLTTLIRENGGKLINDNFMEFLEPDTIELKPQYSIMGFTALIADKHSRKEKYMQALALGLPCLSGKWIEACIQAEGLVDWHQYLLAAGESDELEGATKSRLMDRMDTARVRLFDILGSRKLMLEAAKVVVVMGRGKTEAKRRPYLFLVQALGAERVEQVADLKAAKDLISGADIFDWVFVEDDNVDLTRTELYGKSRRKSAVGEGKGPGCRVAGNKMIVQSLIMGKLCE